ncbi:hypothetical protein BZZ01_09950 [Nostocales cyanobacterium HT-58-2]|nr:hypothetical protein BZZ01_09950 [Nostocales cyanobacterium HT-58-2]
MRFRVLPILFSLPLAFLPTTRATAVTVSPFGVNVSTFSPTSVYLTFRGLENQRAAEALWCGEINANNSCVPGTIFGRLPRRYNRGTPSGPNNYTDIMTIPPSVARRAYQDAARGNSPEFFYVRRFVSTTGGPDEYVAVTCRLAGSSARIPFSLTNVRLRFDKSDPVVLGVARGQNLPRVQADIRYNGSGRLKGRWEVVQPGDTPPNTRDLLPEASLPPEQRALQRRYTLIEPVDVFLPPTGRVILPGPDPSKLPTTAGGLHLILLRVEATNDADAANSQTGFGTVFTGGVAGSPLPVLRYYVGNGDDVTRKTTKTSELQLLLPNQGAKIANNQPVSFNWQQSQGASAYRLEVESDKTPILSAVLDAKTTRYTAPPWLQERAGQTLRWRVQAIAPGGKTVAESEWSEFQLQKQ